MSEKAWKILGLVGAASMLAMLIVSVAMEGCTSMLECTSGFVPMKCHWTFIVTAYLGGLGCILGIIGAFQKECSARRVAAVASILIAVCAIIITTSLGIGTCAHEDSGCHPVAHAVWVCGGIDIIIWAIMAIKANVAAKEKPKMQL